MIRVSVGLAPPESELGKFRRALTALSSKATRCLIDQLLSKRCDSVNAAKIDGV